MSNKTVNELPTANTIDGAQDILPIYTASEEATQGINRNTLLGLASAPVGLTDTQTLTNKTLTSPAISSAVLSGTLTGTYTIGGNPTFPSSVVTLTDTQTLTNKTLTSPTVNSPTITNATLSADTITGYTDTDTGSVYGMSVANGILASAALSNTVNTAALQASAVTTAKIADAAVTAAKRSQVVAIGTISPTTTGNFSVTGVGFTPKLVRFTAMLSASTSASNYGVGAMTSSAQYVASIAPDGSSGSRNSSTSACIGVLNQASSTWNTLGSYVSMDSDGFTINFSTASGSSPSFSWEAWG